MDFVIENGVLTKYTGNGGDVVIPEGITSIGDDAFEYCHSLTSVTIPAGVTTIGARAFCQCSSLTGITIPDSVTSIRDRAFYNCSSLTSITIPDSITSIGVGVFSWCSSLTDITIPDRVTSIGDDAFEYCHSLTSVTIPAGVTTIGARAFCQCSSLTSITIPDSVTSIRDRAFSNCSSLTSITIPDSITSIGVGVFSWCSSLTDITIPDRVTSIGMDAFYGCRSLTSVTIPGSVTTIGERAFIECSSLTSMTILGSVMTIGNWAFTGCNSLKDIAFPNAIPAIEADAFYGCSGIQGITLPDGWGVTENALPGWIRKAANMTAMDAGWILIYQTKAWKTLIDSYILGGIISANDTALAAIQAVNRSSVALTKAGMERVQAFLLDYGQRMEESTRQSLVNALQNNSPKVWKKIDWTDALEPKQLDELEQYVFANSKHTDLFAETMKVSESTVSYSDGSGKAPRTVIAALLAEYMDLWNRAKELTSGYMGDVEILTGSTGLAPSAFGDELAAKLDRKELSAYLLKLTGRPDYRKWLLCFVQYATQEDMAEYIRSLSGNHEKELVKKKISAIAVAMSNTRAAMLFAEKMGTLEQYANYRGTDAETFRDTVLADFGFDEAGTKTYDLGGTTIVVSLQKDLTLSLFDTKQGKIVKSIPKKGNDEILVADAGANFTELKKNVKKVAKSRGDRLFEFFLSGAKTDGQKWKNAYLHNPVLRHVAELIVWQQGSITFVLKEFSAIKADGDIYEITDDPILVAHPIEMTPVEVEAWQKYFVSNGLRQPFAQIWECAINPSTVKSDRYAGCTVPINFFRGAKKHGLSFYDEDFHGSVGFSVDIRGCCLEGERTESHRHELLPHETFTLGQFTFKKYTRRVNHLVTVLDRWTIFDRIKKDDVSIQRLLDNFTLAQIMDFIRMATECNAVNVTALLLEYKNVHYPESDPMAEFTLDW